MLYVSLYAVQQALKERGYWAFCGAMATPTPVRFGPNLRLLPACKN